MEYTLLTTLILGAVMRSSAVPKPASVDLFALHPEFKNSYELLEQYGDFMLSTMNRSVDPCENFYEYACGNWKTSDMLTEKEQNTDFLAIFIEQIHDQILAFLQNATQEQLQDKNHSTSAEWKAKQFFASCVQMKSNLSLGYEKFMGKQDDRYAEQGKQHYQNASQDWIYLNFMSNYNVYPLLPLDIVYINETSLKYEINLSKPTEVLLNVTEEQLQNMTRDFNINDEQKRKDFLAHFAHLTEFERNLTQLVKLRNATEQLQLGEFLTQHKEDPLNWTRYFDVAFNGTQKSSWPVTSVLQDVGELVHFLEGTDVKILRSYVQHRVLLKFYELWTVNSLNGTVASACGDITETYFNYALLPWFIGENFDKQRRADVLTVAKDIKDTFYDLLDQYTWLDDETRSEAKTKLSSMNILVGYSDEMQHREIFNAKYCNVNMTSDWYENIATLEANSAKELIGSVDTAKIPQISTTFDSNASYLPPLNRVFMSMSVLEWPFYHVDFPPVLKYGGIGNIAGHEMAHGFDSFAYQYNYDGKKVNWWSAASLRNFRERYRCLESQYNKYILLGVKTNGNLTLGENIADNVGARMAYRAFERRMGDEAWQTKPLRGIEFNNKQLFFLKFAQSWCTGADNASKLSNMKIDVHTNEEFRVVGTLSNMPEFSEAFNCKLGTDMNPLKKCVVW